MRFSFNYIWIYGGVLGLLIFLGLYHSFSIYGAATIDYSRESIADKSIELWQELGLYSDSLEVYVYQYQNKKLYDYLNETHDEILSPVQIKNNYHALTGWFVILMHKVDDFTMSGPNNFYRDYGVSRIIYDNSGRILRLSLKNSLPVDSLSQKKTLREFSEYLSKLVFDIDYNTLELAETKMDGNPATVDETVLENREWTDLHLKWVLQERRPVDVYFMMHVRQAEQVNQQYEINITEIGIQLGEHKDLPTVVPSMRAPLVISIAVVFVIAIIFIYMVLRQIFRGEIIWKRVFIISSIFTIIWISWRSLIVYKNYSVYRTDDIFTDVVIGIFASIMFSVITALGYITWESVARRQKQHQLALFDAAWRMRFFFRETGGAIINGYALAGTLLGFFALAAYGTDNLAMINDGSGFGYAESVSLLPSLSVWLNTWVNSWFAGFVYLGIIVSAYAEHIKNEVIVFVLSSITAAFIYMGGGWFLTVESELLVRYLVLLIVIMPAIFAIRYIGMFTFLTGYSVAFGLNLIIPFFGSADPVMAMNFYGALFLLALPLPFGIVAYFKAPSVEGMQSFIPEYQQRIARQIHFEKEIQMAKDSQMTLLPHEAPKLEGADIDGFFIPSLDVGGDYYDFNIKKTGSEEVLQFTVADVSGKGMKAAMNAIFTSGLILSRLNENNPAEILTAANKIFKLKTDAQVFVTCLQAEYHPKTHNLIFTNAGNCKPLLKRNNRVEFVESQNPRFPLGAIATAEYQNTEITLKTGDLLLFYSDGLPEAKNVGGAYFEYESISDFMMKLDTDSLSSNEICEQFKKEILEFSDYELADDVTVIALKIC